LVNSIKESAVGYVYNHPANWPTPPFGWVPPEGWVPDPAWGPAPADWAFWLSDDEMVPVEDPAGASSAEVFEIHDTPAGALLGAYAAMPVDDLPDVADEESDSVPLRTDIEGAVERMGRTLGIRRELRNLVARLDPGESVIELARVERAGHGCLLVLSDQRLLFLREGRIRNTVEEVPIRALTSVGSRRRLGNGALLVTVAGNAEVWPMTSGTHSERVSEAIRQVMRQHVVAVTQAASSEPLTAPAPMADPIAQLQKLGELRDAGILTDEEFAAKKASILARM
jgi:hypothetical protein